MAAEVTAISSRCAGLRDAPHSRCAMNCPVSPAQSAPEAAASTGLRPRFGRYAAGAASRSAGAASRSSGPPSRASASATSTRAACASRTTATASGGRSTCAGVHVAGQSPLIVASAA